MNHELEIKIKHAPASPGIYLMKDTEGRVIYVGKAKNLRNRVRNYFGGTDSRFMIPFLVSRIHDLEFIVTKTEKEALILENNLIKQHRPRYNVDFRDDKAYFNIRLDPSSPFPRFQLVRRPRKDGARYFGPYPSSQSAKETLRFLQSVFPLRTCRDEELRGRKRPCLEYEIGRCKAPCVGWIDDVAYRHLVSDSLAFLEGWEKALIADLRSRMTAAAESLNFEEAAVIRDRMEAIEKTIEKQHMVSMAFKDQDAFGYHSESGLIQICAVLIRRGKMIGKKGFPRVRLMGSPAEILSSALRQYYDSGIYIPEEVLLPEGLEDQDAVSEWLSEQKGRHVSVTAPRRGRGKDLVGMACRNAGDAFRLESLSGDDPEANLNILARQLKLKNRPERIECFDISNIGGHHAVGSMVTFFRGKPRKEGYRRYRIRTVEGADDYAMMYEILKRRYGKGEGFPDLIMVDGGKGQLGVALSVIKDLGITGIDVIALAKEVPGEGVLKARRQEDRVYLQGRKDPVYLSRWPAALHTLQRIRDEAHRFAVTYHRRLKVKTDLQSRLDEIPGIGLARKKALLKFFGGMEKLRAASPESLQSVAGIGKETAKKIFDFLHSS